MLARTFAWAGVWVCLILLLIDLGRDKCPMLIGG